MAFGKEKEKGIDKIDKMIPRVEVPAHLRGPAADAVSRVIDTPPSWRLSDTEREALEAVTEQRRVDAERRQGSPANGGVQHDIAEIEAAPGTQVEVKHVGGEQQIPVDFMPRNFMKP